MSEKSIAARLLIKPGYRVLLVNAPERYEGKIGELPDRVNVLRDSNDPVDLIQVFVKSRQDLEARLGKLKNLLKPNGLLWVSYPKGTSKIKADINRDSINAYANTIGLQGVAMISIEETWSALRLKPRTNVRQ